MIGLLLKIRELISEFWQFSSVIPHSAGRLAYNFAIIKLRGTPFQFQAVNVRGGNDPYIAGERTSIVEGQLSVYLHIGIFIPRSQCFCDGGINGFIVFTGLFDNFQKDGSLLFRAGMRR